MQKYDETDGENFLDNDAILGHSGFFRGFGEMKFAVGGMTKMALHLAPGAHESFVRALDVGVQINVFTRRLPIMIIEENKFFYANFM